MLANLIRGFCQENNYKVYERYSGRYTFGRMTIGIIVRQDQNYFFTLHELTRYLDSQEIEEPIMMQFVEELEGVSIDELGLDYIIYFPAIKDYP